MPAVSQHRCGSKVKVQVFEFVILVSSYIDIHSRQPG